MLKSAPKMRKSILVMTLLSAGIVGLGSSVGAKDDIVVPQAFGKLDIAAAVKAMPETSDRPLVEKRLLDNGTTGIRVFRVYKPVPRHHHKFSDTYLYVLSGEAEVEIEGKTKMIAKAGDLAFWTSGTDHEVTRLVKEPFILLAIDSPFRREGDVTFFSGR